MLTFEENKEIESAIFKRLSLEVILFSYHFQIPIKLPIGFSAIKNGLKVNETDVDDLTWNRLHFRPAKCTRWANSNDSQQKALTSRRVFRRQLQLTLSPDQKLTSRL